MRFIDRLIKCVQFFIAAGILYLVVSGVICFALYCTFFPDAGYSAALPASLLVSFFITLAVVYVFFRWRWSRQSHKKSAEDY